MTLLNLTEAILRRFGVVLREAIKHLITITLYSFWHSGAIYLFKRTGSISKLQSAMGHSSKVSLTYLRGLEVPELTEEDMPVID